MFDRTFCDMSRSQFIWHRHFRARVNASDDASANMGETASAKGMESAQTVSFQHLEVNGASLIKSAIEGACDGLAVGPRQGIELSENCWTDRTCESI